MHHNNNKLKYKDLRILMEITVTSFGLDKFTEFLNGEVKETKEGVKYIKIN